MKRQSAAKTQSAGVLLFRWKAGKLQIFLGHPGGPFWARKDVDAWSIPKGLIGPREAPLAAAMREFAEETGHEPRGDFLSLGSAKQPGGKIIHAWAAEDDWDADQLRSNTFEMEMATKIGAPAELSGA